MKTILPFLIAVIILFFAACSSENKNSEKDKTLSKEDIEDIAEKEAVEASVSGYATIEELSEEVIASIKNNDYEDYLKHVMTKEMEKTMAAEISEESKRDYFLGEFGFSIEREKQDFEYLVRYLKDRNVSLDNIKMNEIEVVDYKHEDYSPIELKEVIIVVPHEYELLLIYTAIKVKDKWFLTSELEI